MSRLDFAAEQSARLSSIGLGVCACGDDIAGHCVKCDGVTAHTLTDEQIREYVRAHRRDPWMGGGPGKGTVGDAEIILYSSSTPYESKCLIREEFARLINAKRAA